MRSTISFIISTIVCVAAFFYYYFSIQSNSLSSELKMTYNNFQLGLVINAKKDLLLNSQIFQRPTDSSYVEVYNKVLSQMEALNEPSYLLREDIRKVIKRIDVSDGAIKKKTAVAELQQLLIDQSYYQKLQDYEQKLKGVVGDEVYGKVKQYSFSATFGVEESALAAHLATYSNGLTNREYMLFHQLLLSQLLSFQTEAHKQLQMPLDIN